MSLSTTITLDKLPEALKQQFRNLYNEIDVNKSGLTKNSQEYEINELSVHVIVTMKTIRNEKPVQEKECKFFASCGGSIDFENNVKVTISPDNANVTKVVSDHFKSQVSPRNMSAPEKPLFHGLTINKQKFI